MACYPLALSSAPEAIGDTWRRGVGLRDLVRDLFRVEQEHDHSGDQRGYATDSAQPQHHRPKIRGPGRRRWNQSRLQRALMPGPIVTETPAFRIVLRQLLDCRSGALPKRGTELVARHLFARRRLAWGLLAWALLAWGLLAWGLLARALFARNLLTHPRGRVFELGPYRILVIGRGHDPVSRFDAAASNSYPIFSLAVLSLRLPLQKFAKQVFPIGIAHRHLGLIAEESLERGAVLLLLLLLNLHLLQLLLCHAESGPAGDRGRQIHVAPFRMVWRMLEKLVANRHNFVAHLSA
jgi:hypothetical protein